ncbi:MAG: hypothetical protein JW791_02730 [Nanoarchaeota archaeon]|nr:hypothetical protein [Nanoarchaeota archaeon]
MNCPLCHLIKRVSEWNVKNKKWSKKIGPLVVRGEQYFTSPKHDKGYKDIVRYFDGEFLFVNSVRIESSSRDVVICMPVKHVNKFDLRKKENSELLRKLDEKILSFIKKEYKSVGGNVRVFENFGSLASIPEHAHKQIVYTKSKGLHLTFIPIKYN